MFYCSKAVLPFMIEQRYGKIINIASVSAMKGGGGLGNTLYGTTKAGVVAMTKRFARELAPMGINVNAIAPAVARTVMTEDRITPELEERIKARIPMGRLGEVSDIACLAAFLASDISQFITGETIAVDGGFLTGWLSSWFGKATIRAFVASKVIRRIQLVRVQDGKGLCETTAKF